MYIFLRLVCLLFNFWLIEFKIISKKQKYFTPTGAFNNYGNKILPNSDSVDFLMIPHPSFFIHIVIKCPQLDSLNSRERLLLLYIIHPVRCTSIVYYSTSARLHELGQSLALAPSSNGRCKISLRTSAVSWSEKSHCCPSIAVYVATYSTTAYCTLLVFSIFLFNFKDINEFWVFQTSLFY